MTAARFGLIPNGRKRSITVKEIRPSSCLLAGAFSRRSCMCRPQGSGTQSFQIGFTVDGPKWFLVYGNAAGTSCKTSTNGLDAAKQYHCSASSHAADRARWPADADAVACTDDRRLD